MDFVFNLVQAIVGVGLVVFVYFAARKVMAREPDERDPDTDETAGRKILCPECGYDIRVTPEQCPKCGTRPQARRDYFRRLRSSFPADRIDPRVPKEEEDVVLVLTTREWNEADLVAAQLKARGVPASIHREKSPLEYGQTAARPEYRVIAYSGDAEIIQAFMSYARGDTTDDSDSIQ